MLIWLTYTLLWLLLAAALAFSARLLRTQRPQPAPEPADAPTGTQVTQAAARQVLAGVMLIIALLVLAWSMLPPDQAVIAGPVCLIVLFVLWLQQGRCQTRSSP